MDTSTSDIRDLRQESMESLKPRDRILKTALALFNDYGVHTVGIDRIIAESGVSKRTFYNHFPSKSDLIAAYLDFRDWLRFSDLDKFASRSKGGAKGEILAMFDYLEYWFGESDFNGCAFARGLSDFNNEDSRELRAKVDHHFHRLADFIKKRLVELVKADKIKILMPQLLSLITGSVIVAHATGDARIAQLNKKIANALLSE